MLLFCLLNSANRVFEDTECNEFQTVMFLCFLSGACHIPVLFSLSRVYFVCCGYLTSKANRLSVEEYQIRLEAVGRCCLLLEWIQFLGLVLFGLSMVYTFYVVLTH